MDKTEPPKASISASFGTKLKGYKKLIDADITSYSRHVRQTTLEQYGKNARLEIDAFLNILERGGKRIRGSLVLNGYEMSGGQDKSMILQVARAVEMFHAYILIIDDIQDCSDVRRSGPAAHVWLSEYHKQHSLSGDSAHFGVSVALNAALAGAHAAQVVLANIDAPEDLRLKVLSIMNRTMLVTAHGQTNDIMNEVVAQADAEDIERVLEWKTAHYTFLNPLHVGMVLAGADCHATDAITPFAIHAGKAFQITDDIIGVFASEQTSGKSPMDDVREGKRTLLMLYALEHSTDADKNFLIQMLGNSKLTQVEFERCREILVETGALDYAKSQAQMHIDQAISSLDHEYTRWSKDGVSFLYNLANSLLGRAK
ncbi:MAG: polyprenyl synthetase family protein [Candidatus Saccharimonadales bacterium]